MGRFLLGGVGPFWMSGQFVKNRTKIGNQKA
jgi:hypothetical protein